MIIIKTKGKRLEYALKEYRQKVDKIGTLRELRERRTFKKKSQRRREQINKAKYKNKNDKS